MPNIFDELHDLAPAGREVNTNVVASHWAHRDQQRQTAQQALQAAQKAAQANAGDVQARNAVADAETRAGQAQRAVSELARQLREEVAQGSHLWTTAGELTAEQRIDQEEARDRVRRGAEAYAGAEGTSAVEMELRAVRRELERLRGGVRG